MIVYHGSFLEIPQPDIYHSRVEVDFGRGFYTTPLLEQAEKWSRKFLRRGTSAIINEYTFDESALTKCRMLSFDAYSELQLMNANPILLQMKYARVVSLFAKQTGLTLDEALGAFYHSTLYGLVREGVSDLHCMSDAYLAEYLKEEYKK